VFPAGTPESATDFFTLISVMVPTRCLYLVFGQVLFHIHNN